MKHTPEPWHVDGPLDNSADFEDDPCGSTWFDIMGDGHSVCHLPYEARPIDKNDFSQLRADAKRIVECVNAMQNIPFPKAFVERAYRIDQSVKEFLLAKTTNEKYVAMKNLEEQL